MIYFTSDEHYGHESIIKHCNRPFKDKNEMDSVIISNFNSVVNSKDTVYHLGDFSFQNPLQYLKRLNGKHYLIIGNHDAKQHYGFEWAKDCFQLKNVLPNFHIYISHYSHRVWPQAHFGSGHLFGHSHNTLESYGRSFDIGVDTNNFFPYSIEEIIEKFKTMDPYILYGKDPLKEK